MAKKNLNTPLSQKKYTRTTSKIPFSITEFKVFIVIFGIFALFSAIPFALQATVAGGVVCGIGFVLGIIMIIPIPQKRIFVHDYAYRFLK